MVQEDPANRPDRHVIDDEAAHLAGPAEMDEVESLIGRWLDDEQTVNPVIAAVDREPAQRRWFVRLRGEEKDITTLWLRVDQRSLFFETYVMPAPEENQAAFYEHLLRRNLQFNGMAFCIGDEDAVFLRGQLPIRAVDRSELDRILGSTYAYVEKCFRPALRIGFASRFDPTSR